MRRGLIHVFVDQPLDGYDISPDTIELAVFYLDATPITICSIKLRLALFSGKTPDSNFQSFVFFEASIRAFIATRPMPLPLCERCTYAENAPIPR